MIGSKRKLFGAVAAAVVVAGVLAVVMLRPRGDSVDPGERLAPDTGVNAAAGFAGDPDEVLQSSGGSLQLRGASDWSERDLGEITSNFVTASPSSPWVAYLDVSPSLHPTP